MDKKYGERLDDWNKTADDSKSTPQDTNTPKTSTAEVLYSEACRLDGLKRHNEALCLINVAIENDDGDFKYFLKKGSILESLNRFKESRQAYDRALELNDTEEIYESKARMLYRWANSLNDKRKALELIEDAILILPSDCEQTYHEKFWYLKGSILDCLERPIESRRCYLIAEGMSDGIRELDEQVEFLKNSKDTLINVTGTRFYHGLEAFKKGLIVNLIKEDDNEHDPDAIRVELQGETLGYVANNEYTLIDNVKSATQIRNLDFDKAEVMLIYLDEYVIARLVK